MVRFHYSSYLAGILYNYVRAIVFVVDYTRREVLKIHSGHFGKATIG